MYPVWASPTTYPVYVGLRSDGWWFSLAPCAPLAYGLCVVGGVLHSGFTFATVLPQVVHHPHPTVASPECTNYMQLAQAKLMGTDIFVYTPGPLAIMIASMWITIVVARRETKCP